MLLAAALLMAPPTLPVYLDLGKAPPALEQRINDRIRASLQEQGVPIAPDPSSPLIGGADPIADAKRELETGVKAYAKLDLDTALPALRAAEQRASAALTSPAVAGIVAEARVTLGLISLAQGKTGEADEHFRRAASLEPDRRLDGRLHPPEVVTAYDAARASVAKSPMCELTLALKPAGGRITVDGRPASGTVRLPYGVHYIAAASEAGVTGERVELTQPRALVALEIRPDPNVALASLRAAAKRGDDVALGAAADALAAAAGAERVILWDLRSQKGRVEAPMRLRDVTEAAFTWQVVANLGTAAAPDAPLQKALAELLGDSPVARRTPPPRLRGGSRSLPSWVWWAAGGVAIAAAGGAAALTLDGGKSEDDEVVVVVEK